MCLSIQEVNRYLHVEALNLDIYGTLIQRNCFLYDVLYVIMKEFSLFIVLAFAHLESLGVVLYYLKSRTFTQDSGIHLKNETSCTCKYHYTQIMFMCVTYWKIEYGDIAGFNDHAIRVEKGI